MPHEWRFYDDLCRYPFALARIADGYLEVAIEAARTGYQQVPANLLGQPEGVIEKVREVCASKIRA
ncbi:hypothetical protein ACWCOT_04580 [Nonomuraea bangladeshensis]